MCLRLYAATDTPLPLGRWVSAAGLDCEVAPLECPLAADAPACLVELCYGACACHLATGRALGRRVAEVAEKVLAAGARLELLLVDEQGRYRWEAADPRPWPLTRLADQGVGGLPEGQVVSIYAP
ncbi:MAG: hypothetical protein D6729_07755 [Deltaproteobacteria bacterium]|nr:MAG: hypothetical protein D6729_07755 [Deltaproteobacteria bacterium]